MGQWEVMNMGTTMRFGQVSEEENKKQNVWVGLNTGHLPEVCMVSLFVTISPSSLKEILDRTSKFAPNTQNFFKG